MGQNTQTVKFKEIVIDRNLNPRLELDEETIEHYIDVFDQLPPVILYETERGKLLTDGFHRHQAAKALGKKEMVAELRQGTYREAMEFAALANLQHGKPLTTKERSRVAETMLLLHSDWADREIGRRCGTSQPTVGNIRKRLEAEGRLIKTISRVGGDGIQRSVPAANPEPKPEPPPDPWDGMVLQGDTFDLLPTIEDGSIDLLFADPPYGILNEDWDKFPSPKDLMQFTRRWLSLALPKLKRTGRLYICYSQWYVHLLRSLMGRFEREFGLEYSNTIVWHYGNMMTKANNRCEYKIAHEPILYYRATDAPKLDFSVYGEEQGDVWDIATPQSNYNEGKDHPAQKPLELLRRVIATGCPAAGLVLDPFGGSGTTAVAASELMRGFKIIERDPNYVAVIRRRLDSLKSKGASHQMALADG